VVQERRTTNHLEDEVTHNGPAEDCILNLAQLRSATDVQQFRSGARYPNTSLVEVIENSIRNKEQLERDLQMASEEKEVEKAEKEAKKAENLEKRRRKEEERKTKAAEKEATRQKLAGEAGLRKRKRAETSTVAGPSLTRARKEGEMLDDI
jgi:chromatin remodeling complex protein RSC6